MLERYSVNAGTGITHIGGRHYVEIWCNGRPWFSFQFGKSLFTAIDYVRQLNGVSPEWSMGLADRYTAEKVTVRQI